MFPLPEARIRVLIVDDHPLVRKGIEVALATEGDMEMAGEAADGQEAIEKFQECKPDVVLMDLRMPKIGGVEAARRLRQLDPEARIIALTSYDGDARGLVAGTRSERSGRVRGDREPEQPRPLYAQRCGGDLQARR